MGRSPSALDLAEPLPQPSKRQQTQETDFTVYNDLASPNSLKITSPMGASGLTSTGLLKDFTSGIDTGVTLTVTGGSFDGTQTTQGEDPTMDDGFTIFDAKVSGLGATY